MKRAKRQKGRGRQHVAIQYDNSTKLMQQTDEASSQHDSYCHLNTSTETPETKAGNTQTIFIGYDPAKWVETDMQIRDKERHQCNYDKIVLPPVQGNTNILIATTFTGTSTGSSPLGNGHPSTSTSAWEEPPG